MAIRGNMDTFLAIFIVFRYAAEFSSFTIDPWPSLMRHKHTPEAQANMLNAALLNSTTVKCISIYAHIKIHLLIH